MLVALRLRAPLFLHTCIVPCSDAEQRAAALGNRVAACRRTGWLAGRLGGWRLAGQAGLNRVWVRVVREAIGSEPVRSPMTCAQQAQQLVPNA